MRLAAVIGGTLMAAVQAVTWPLAAAATPTDGTGPNVHPAAPAAAPDSTRQAELLRLLRQDCGSCHGMRLTGGLGPPLTPQALRDKPADSLTATIVAGRAGTAMPPWRSFLSETEATWLVERLQQGDAHAR